LRNGYTLEGLPKLLMNSRPSLPHHLFIPTHNHVSATIALSPGGSGSVEWPQLVFGTPLAANTYLAFLAFGRHSCLDMQKTFPESLIESQSLE